MPNENHKLGFNKMRSIFFFGLIAILAVAILYIMRPFIYPVFWAAVIAIMFYPVYKRLLKHLKSPNFSALISMLLVIIIVFIPLSFLSTLLVNQSIALYQSVAKGDFMGKVAGASQWLQQSPLAPYLENVRNNWTVYAENATKTISIFLFNNLKNVTQNSLRFIFMLLIMFYALFYFFRDGARMLKRLMHLSPLGDKYEQMLYEKFTSTARATLKGTFIVGSLQGVLGGLLFWFTGIEGALIWGVVMVALSIIPAVGPAPVWLPAGLIMLALGNVWQGLTILLFGALVIGLIDNILRPVLVGKDIQMHPLLVLFATLGGIFIFGLSGFVIGPVIAALFIAVMTIYDHHYRNELQNN